MRAIIIVILIFLYSNLSFAQPKFDVASFNEKFRTAQWLLQYDIIAWWTSDSVYVASKEEQGRLGAEWFCFQDKKIWHAAYGKFTDNKYDLVFHYIVDTTLKIKRTNKPIDTSLTHSYSRAIINAGNLVRMFNDSLNTRFNQFIKRNDDKTLSVWLLPAFTPDGVAVYGGEFYYKFDATGNKLLDKFEYYQGGFKGFKANNPQEIVLNYRDVDQPTLGSVFFVWYYKKYFSKISIDTKKSNSSLQFEKEKGYSWMHVEKEN